MVKKVIYLDYAAATPLDSTVLETMRPYFNQRFFNPSATYLAGRSVAQEINRARTAVAKCLGAKASEIVFTAGGTEANNLAISGVMQVYPSANIVISAIEHESVSKPASLYKHNQVKVGSDGIIDLIELNRKINDKTVLVSVIYANNEIGTVQPLKQISQLIGQIRRQRLINGNKMPILLHSDACQAGAYFDLHVKRLGLDLMTINGGKIYGPKQSGALFIKAGIKLNPQILGGGQEFGMRSGTENTANIIGLARALEIAQSNRKQEHKRLSDLQFLFLKELQKTIPGVSLNGSMRHRLPNNLNIAISGQDNERLMMALDQAGVVCAVGSACSASNQEPSHVLKAIGLSDKEARSSLRFSMGRDTSAAGLRKAVDILKNCV